MSAHYFTIPKTILLNDQGDCCCYCLQGLFMSTVKCIVCGKESRKFDAFSNLTLPLPSHTNRCTLWVSTKETSMDWNE